MLRLKRPPERRRGLYRSRPELNSSEPRGGTDRGRRDSGADSDKWADQPARGIAGRWALETLPRSRLPALTTGGPVSRLPPPFLVGSEANSWRTPSPLKKRL